MNGGRKKLSDDSLDEQLMGIRIAENYMGRFRNYFSPGCPIATINNRFRQMRWTSLMNRTRP